MSKTEDSIMAIAVILQHMRSTDDALRVLKQFIGTCDVCSVLCAVCSALWALLRAHLLVELCTIFTEYTVLIKESVLGRINERNTVMFAYELF